MFDETKKYKNKGHFFFKKGDRLIDASKDVPELPGIYYIIRLSSSKVDLVYIGKSGTINQSGIFKDQLLKGRINNKCNGIKRQQYFEQKMLEEYKIPSILNKFDEWVKTFEKDTIQHQAQLF